jgi:hypothetical protein
METDVRYFLSANNPLANIDQKRAEQMAVRIAASPAGQRARERAAFMWRRAMGHDGATAEAWTLFEAAMDEYAFNYILKAVSCDANYPALVQNFRPPHRWFGMEVSGSRMGGDNPDNSYRHVGIAHGARYELEGKPVGRGPAHASFSLVANFGTSKTVCALDSRDLVFEGDGCFQITIDDRDANGRPNHLRTTPAVKFLYIRDSMEDWATETPYSYRIRRLDPPDADPISEEHCTQIAAEAMEDDVPLYYWFTRLPSGLPRNTQAAVSGAANLGGLITQAGSLGHFRLQDDDAAIIHVDPAGAAYSGFVVHDWWFRTIQYWSRTSSLTSTAMASNADGTRTMVLSLQDPGLHNWIDPGGLHDLTSYFRWQGLPRTPVRSGPSIDLRMVKLKDLEQGALPDARRITPAGRREQRAAREAACARRWVDQ